jgi:hypothetical protein
MADFRIVRHCPARSGTSACGFQDRCLQPLGHPSGVVTRGKKNERWTPCPAERWRPRAPRRGVGMEREIAKQPYASALPARRNNRATFLRPPKRASRRRVDPMPGSGPMPDHRHQGSEGSTPDTRSLASRSERWTPCQGGEADPTLLFLSTMSKIDPPVRAAEPG